MLPAEEKLPPLMPHQERGVQFLLQAKGRALLADEMGLGKTRTTIEYLKRAGLQATVVTTKSFLYGWKAELERWWPEAKVEVCARRTDPVGASQDVLIISYDVLWRWSPAVLNYLCPGTCVVFDESHKLASAHSKRSKAARLLVAGKPHVICLTGTPQPAGQPQQLWHQLLLVGPSFLTWPTFRDKFCDPKKVWAGYAGRFIWDYTGASNLGELRQLLKGRMLRRTKKLLNLPPLTTADVRVPVRLKRRKEEAWAAYSARLAEAKIAHTVRLVEDCLERGHKAIVFTSYKAVRDAVWAACIETPSYDSVIITAGTPPVVRAREVQKFQEEERFRVFCATTQIASEALTLTAADVVIFNDLPWTPGMLDQALSRAHRKGQTKSVQGYFVQSAEPLDAVVREVLAERRAVTERVLEEKLGQ